MKVCLILCFLNALTSSKKKFAQTYGKNRDINHDLCLNLSLSPIQTLQMGRRAKSYAGEIKSETFNLTDISAYFRYRKEVEGDNLLSDQTYSDLGVEELFTFADRTVSRVGQQYLYQTLRSVPQAAGEISRHEEIIRHLQADSHLRERLAKTLSHLRDTEAYSIVRLLADEQPAASTNRKVTFAILKCLPALFLLLYLLLHIPACGLFFLVAIILNAGIHYTYKPKSIDYIYSVPPTYQTVRDSREAMQNPGTKQVGDRHSGCLGHAQAYPENRPVPPHGEQATKRHGRPCLALHRAAAYLLPDRTVLFPAIRLYPPEQVPGDRNGLPVRRADGLPVVRLFPAGTSALLLPSRKTGREAQTGQSRDVPSFNRRLCRQLHRHTRQIGLAERIEHVRQNNFYPHHRHQCPVGTNPAYGIRPFFPSGHPFKYIFRPDACRRSV